MVLVGYDGERTYLVTYGVTKADCEQAASAQEWWDGKTGPQMAALKAKYEAAIGPAAVATLVDRFLAWPLPQSVASDLCVTDPNYAFPRRGTSLLTATEATQMIEYLLAGGG